MHCYLLLGQLTLHLTSLPSPADGSESYRCVVGPNHVVPAVARSDNILVCYVPLDSMSFTLDDGLLLVLCKTLWQSHCIAISTKVRLLSKGVGTNFGVG